MIASVAVSAAVYAIDKPYSYLIPDSMTVEPGMRVVVPFGRGNRRSEGIVLSVEDQHAMGLKPVERVMDSEPVLSESFIRMAAFLRERYFCTFYDAIKAMLPAGLWFDVSERFELTGEHAAIDHPYGDIILQELSNLGGAAGRAELKKAVPDEAALEEALQFLRKKKLISSNLDYSRKVRDKTEQVVSLAVPAEDAMEYARTKQKSASVQAELLRLLCAVGSGGSKELCYLTGATGATIKRLEQLGFVEIHTRDVFRNSLPTFVEQAKPFHLNSEQQAAFEAFSAQSRQEKPGVGLLYGVTGSGKTAVYLRLIRDILDRGQGALYLVPEISLTPQLIQLLMSHFGDTVAVLHSALRVSERYDEWKRIRQGNARVVIGTRSAIFAPVPNLGLIILDEEQEHTYKSENNPRYHAREVAIYRGSREHALVLLGSATPSLETMYLAKTGVYTLQSLTTRFNGKHLPQVQILDMKQEIRQGNNTGLSLPLQQALEETIRAGHQSILFLNRRGAGRYQVCVECGDVPQCPRCSVSLTYHKANNRLMCHYCGHSQPVIDRCGLCGGAMKVVGTGTQKLEQELQERFPGVEILRMDADTITASNNHEAILERFRREGVPILIGTQMVTKGLNFENVTLVGIIDADMSLYVNHYRASETTFSMLTQVIGRAGRGSLDGVAMVQTMTPEHSVIRLAARQDYDQFYEQELSLRRMMHCPPFGDLFTVRFSGIFESNTLAAAHDFRQQLVAVLPPDQAVILGPSPASVAKVNNAYRFQLTIQCVNSRAVRLLLGQQLQIFAKDKRHKGITAIADINSYE